MGCQGEVVVPWVAPGLRRTPLPQSWELGARKQCGNFRLMRDPREVESALLSGGGHEAALLGVVGGAERACSGGGEADRPQGLLQRLCRDACAAWAASLATCSEGRGVCAGYS